MPLLFTQLCDLLSTLEGLSTRDPPLLPARFRHLTNETIKSWFASRRVSINSTNVDVVALLSSLFPIKRTDRVYSIQPPRLSRCLRRWLCLGKTRWPQLDQWQQPGRGGLAECVERVLQQAEFPLPHNKDRVTLEEVDDALATVAARCRFSAPKVRARGVEEDSEVSNALEKIYQRLQSREAKWFTRLILKDFSCVELPENLIYASIDPRLRVAMQMYHDFEFAICELRKLPASQMADSVQGGFTQQCAEDAHLLPPKAGVKLGPPKWVKAKGGIKHAVSIIDGRSMSVERKHDGEYCQIHVDLSKGVDCIQIFSKSGKDSTSDRAGVHQAIKNALRIGSQLCRFSERCIVEGELLVYSDQTRAILDFHKIRKHVSRSGSFLGTTLDSQPHPWEHLMIVFYDVMLLDDEPLLHQPYKVRRSRLEDLIQRIEGHSNLVYRKNIDFSTPEGPNLLRELFSKALVSRWEGLVLKPADESYFELARSTASRYPSRWIKLKKDCIRGLGDTADFAVVGAGYDATKATKFNIPNLRWTHFYMACLPNKGDVLRSDAKHHFFVFDQVSDCIKRDDLKTLNELGHIRAMEPNSSEADDLFTFKLAPGISGIKAVFRAPFVFDIAGSGFDKPPNRDIFSLRFPRVMKIHWDRSWKEAVDLEELQEMAAKAMKIPPKKTWLEEKAFWQDQLNQIDNGGDTLPKSWDLSEDEEDQIEQIPPPIVAATTSRASRRSHVPAAPPFVRMDTGEMQVGERRLSSGEVVERPVSQHSMASITTKGSLPTPPTSSPLPKAREMLLQEQSLCAESLIPINHDRTRKRFAANAGLEEAHPPSKRQRPLPDHQSTTPIACPSAHYSPTPKIKTPLRVIANPPDRLLPPRDGASIQDKTQTGRDFSLVRKIPSGAEVPAYERHKKRRRLEVPSSPDRVTTASESTSAKTSQRSDLQGANDQPLINQLQTDPSRSGQAQDAQASNLLTPPSTADPPPTIKLPDLRSSKLVLSPCLIREDDHQAIPPVKELLTALSIQPSSFKMAFRMPGSNDILKRTAEETAQIILLVEFENAEKATKQMRMILRNIPKWHPIPCAVWDWRVLQVIRDHDSSTCDTVDESSFKDHYYANMTWDAEGEDGGGAEVRWGDGRLMRVPRSRIAGMES